MIQNAKVRMLLGGFGLAAAIFNMYQAGLANYQLGKIVWMLVYIAWLCCFVWGFHDWLLAKLKKN